MGMESWMSILVAVFCVFACFQSFFEIGAPVEEIVVPEGPSVARPLANGTTVLRQMLRYRMAFQPQVVEFLYERIGYHMDKKKPTKPLLLSFQGPLDAGQLLTLDIIGTLPYLRIYLQTRTQEHTGAHTHTHTAACVHLNIVLLGLGI
jgi:hypothetical protein